MAILLNISDDDARRAAAVAAALSMSRSEFIRRAIRREIELRLDQALATLTNEPFGLDS